MWTQQSLEQSFHGWVLISLSSNVLTQSCSKSNESWSTLLLFCQSLVFFRSSGRKIPLRFPEIVHRRVLGHLHCVSSRFHKEKRHHCISNQQNGQQHVEHNHSNVSGGTKKSAGKKKKDRQKEKKANKHLQICCRLGLDVKTGQNQNTKHPQPKQIKIKCKHISFDPIIEKFAKKDKPFWGWRIYMSKPKRLAVSAKKSKNQSKKSWSGSWKFADADTPLWAWRQ